MNQLEYRHEYKHSINMLDYRTLRQRIKAVAQLDPNSGADGRYHIRSLYFDNDDDKVLKEKLYGLPNREKYRIRIYNGSGDFIRLEKKSKVHGLCSKQSEPLTKSQVQQILAGDTAWMLSAGNPLLAEFYGKLSFQRLKPKTLVDYRREAYIFPYGNVRVTFDSDIRTGVYSTGLFQKDLPTFTTQEPGLLLLEVKYDNFLPDVIRDLIQTNTRHTEAFSKYAACRIYG
ncbi:MAG: polyphosphate polymerase domain-containing protein [Lacrimispora sp.]|uniref:polyphosphate polymerase domain-containing protein n=1 Tax=Lacrimispora sp. TaxID=2719234 RepID=UPI0039E5138A